MQIKVGPVVELLHFLNILFDQISGILDGNKKKLIWYIVIINRETNHSEHFILKGNPEESYSPKSYLYRLDRLNPLDEVENINLQSAPTSHAGNLSESL